MTSSQLLSYTRVRQISLFIPVLLVHGHVSAQYVPDFQRSIGLLTSVAQSSLATQPEKDAATEAAQTAKELLREKLLADDKVQGGDGADGQPAPDGFTYRRPASVFRKGLETPPERNESVGINGKKIRRRYGDMLASGMSEAEARLACDWIVALTIAHEARHVNQTNEGNPDQTVLEREVDAHTEEDKIADAAITDPSMPEAVVEAIIDFEAEALAKLFIDSMPL